MTQTQIITAFQVAASRKLAVTTEACYRTSIVKFMVFLATGIIPFPKSA